MNGHILITINFTDFDFDTWFSDLSGDRCVQHGLYVGIYDRWKHNENELKIGTNDCGVEYTGQRWDPWKACSTISSNVYCKDRSGSDTNGEYACILPGSYIWSGDNNDENDKIYMCSEFMYNSNPYSCEVGDWSGKYGVLEYNKHSKSW